MFDTWTTLGKLLEMFESAINIPISTVVVNPDVAPLTDAKVYVNGAESTQVVTVIQIGTSPVWSVTFTPNSTGNWSLFAFGAIQERVKVQTKSIYDYLRNIEDEALGSWSWDKDTGVLTLLRQDGSALATFNVSDGIDLSSRERTI